VRKEWSVFATAKPIASARGLEVVLSLGAIHTPKVLMQSGIGDQVELQRLGIPLVQHLPGVGQNFQDHPAIGCIWEYQKPLAPRNNASGTTFFWKSDPSLDTPDIQTCPVEVPIASAEMIARFDTPATSWTMFGGIVRPKSRGRIRLTGRYPLNPVQIETNMMSHSGPKGRNSLCATLPRDRQLRRASSLHQARGDARQFERGGTRKLHPGFSSYLLPSDVHRQDGTRPDVGG
jgi:choline dehydrogenase-like flavoprotein